MVKIAKIEASAHSRPFTEGVIRMGLGCNVKRDFVFVKVTADDGTIGYGEAHHGQNLTAMTEVIEKGVGSLIIGADPFDSEGIWERIKRQQIQTHGLGAGSIIALAGIDLALWDLKGKLLGQPVYRLLGGAAKKSALMSAV
jgi:D-galactarolactone cycloisomerase